MKKVVMFLLVLFSIANCFALEIQFQNDEIQAGETILGTITTAGSFTEEIQDSDIKFYEGRKEKYFEYDFVHYNGTYYFYIYTQSEGEYRLEINNILFKESDQLQSQTIVKYFNVTNDVEIDEDTNKTMTEILSIRPGIASYPKTNKIKLVNVGTETLEIEYDKNDIELEAGEVFEIALSPEEKLSFIDIESYKDFSVPVIYPTFEAEFENDYTTTQHDLKPEVEMMVVELIDGEKSTEYLQLFNFGNNNVTDFEVESDLDFVKLGKLDDMAGRDVQNLTLEFSPDEVNHFWGTINISFVYEGEEEMIQVGISAFVLPEGSTEEDFDEAMEDSEEDCEGLGGTVIKSDDGMVCNGTSRVVTSGLKSEYCCFGDYVEKVEEEKDSKVGLIIGLVILVGLIGYGFYAYEKQKNIGNKSKPEDKLKESTARFEDRMKVRPPANNRVSGGLSKS